MSVFILQDLPGSLRAMAAFAAILFCPGYCVGYATDLFGFRRQSLRERIAAAVALSFACDGIFVTLAGHVLSIKAIALVPLLCFVLTVVLLVRDRRARRPAFGLDLLLITAFILFGSVVVFVEMLDIQRGHELFLSVTTLDQGYRVAFINAVARTGIPPSNPFYHPGQTVPLRYYYFWYALCAVCMKLARVSAREALVGGSVWCLVGLGALIALYAKYLLTIRSGIERYILRGLLLLTVTGLDILPVGYNLFANHDFRGDLEWWSTDQVSSWLDCILWVPNHLAGLLCCLTAFLLLWRGRSQTSRAATILAGVALASAFGLSIYVTFAFAVLMLAWVMWRLLAVRDRKPILHGLTAAALASALLLPFLHEMLAAGSGTEQGVNASPTHMFQFGVRRMIDSSLITNLPVFTLLRASHSRLLDETVRLLLLLPGYALELGVYGLVLVLAFRDRKRLDEGRRTLLFLSVAGLGLAGFLRSAVIGNNDFGYRSAMLPCFFLLLLAMDRLSTIRLARPLERMIFAVLLLAGLTGTVFQAIMLRTFVPLRAARHAASSEEQPQAAFRARAGYRAVERSIPAGALLQSSISATGEYAFVPRMLFAGEAMATDAAVDCGAVFGGDPGGCRKSQQTVQVLFSDPAPSAEAAIIACHTLGVTYLAVSLNDPIWRDQKGWVWNLQQVHFLGDDVEGFRVVNCGPDGKTVY